MGVWVAVSVAATAVSAGKLVLTAFEDCVASAARVSTAGSDKAKEGISGGTAVAGSINMGWTTGAIRSGTAGKGVAVWVTLVVATAVVICPKLDTATASWLWQALNTNNSISTKNAGLINFKFRAKAQRGKELKILVFLRVLSGSPLRRWHKG
jgi:hypothetical protein